MEFQAQPTMTMDNTQQGFPQVAQPVMMQGVQGLPIQFLQQGAAQFPVQGQQVWFILFSREYFVASEWQNLHDDIVWQAELFSAGKD